MEESSKKEKKKQKQKEKAKQKKQNSRKRMASAIATLAITADLTGLYSFFIGGNATEFFTRIWFVNIFLIFIFLYVSVFFLSISNFDKFKNTLLSFYGYSFAIITALFYIFFGYMQLNKSVEIVEFIGSLIVILLFGFSSVIILAFLVENAITDKFIFERNSYLFIFSSIGLSLFLVYKYLIVKADIFIMSISGESITIILGGFIAFFLFRLAQNNNMLDSLIDKLKDTKVISLLFK